MSENAVACKRSSMEAKAMTYAFLVYSEPRKRVWWLHVLFDFYWTKSEAGKKSVSLWIVIFLLKFHSKERFNTRNSPQAICISCSQTSSRHITHGQTHPRTARKQTAFNGQSPVRA